MIHFAGVGENRLPGVALSQGRRFTRRAILLFAGFLLSLLAARTGAQELVSTPIHEFGLGRLRQAAWSSGGEFIVTCSAHGGAYLWDGQTGQRLRTFAERTSTVTALAFSPDSKWILTGNADSTARLWDRETGAPIQSFTGHQGAIRSVVFSADGKKILTASEDKTARLWDVASADELTTFSGHTGKVLSATLSADGSKVLTASEDKTVRLWDATSGQETIRFAEQSSLIAAALSPDGKWIATNGGGNTVKLWDAADNSAPRRTITVSTFSYSSTYAMVFSPDGSTIYVAMAESDESRSNASQSWIVNAIKSWDVATGNPSRTFSGHVSIIHSIHPSADGKQIMSAGWDGTVRLWDVVTEAALKVFKLHNYGISTVTFSPNGKRILVGEGGGMASLWDVQSGERQLLVQMASDVFPYIHFTLTDFSPSGSRFLTSTDDGFVRVWNADTGDQVTTITTGAQRWIHAVFGADDDQVLSGGDAGARLWDLKTGEVRHTFGTAGTTMVKYDRASARAFICFEGERVESYDAETGDFLKSFASGYLTSAMAVQRGGTRLLTECSYSVAATLWDATSGEILRRFEDHSWTNGVRDAALSPEGVYALIGSAEGLAQLFDTRTGAQVRAFYPYADGVPYEWAASALAFSPDGTRILTGSSDGSILLWKTDPNFNGAKEWRLFE